MGLFDKLANILKIKKEQMTILVVGLNNSGKSTIINHFKSPDEQVAMTVPTVGFSVEKFQNQGVSFTALDMSGAGRYRNLWEHQFKNCQGIVYVIDSSDRMRLVVVKDELEILLQHPDLKEKRIPILLYANKMDYTDALSSVKIAAALGLEKIQDKPWHISSSNALSGEGLAEGVQWLVEHIRICLLHTKDVKLVVKDELEILLQHPDLKEKRIPILLYANKMDYTDALSSVKIAAALGLEKIQDKPWHISSSNALSGEGLAEGVQWLVEHIRICLLHTKDVKRKKSAESKLQ